ncbi:class I SAM-dependent methyltransferase [Methylomonas montana]|uniref:class I SAM-dependent methyltransferase n=1 Tax=Methylomonas montana TaxID=3058963 RepID=UPI00265897A3|nr:class I SAM-dependent methyltransferase [Methylomonas montana]WKJ89569.1 class I SAM-dependent methyltransferase [Methylomonas montana]
MNFLEKMAMNNPIRFYIQRQIEAPLLKKLGANVDGLDVLEVGCAHGVGTEIILNQWNAKKVFAFDLDEDMLSKAKNRLNEFSSNRLELFVGDVTNLKFRDNSIGAVVNFAAIHHVPDWQVALSEIHRVLKPNGQFIFQEVTEQWILRWPYNVLFKHPMENRFSGNVFIQELERLGFEIRQSWVQKAGGDFIFGVAKKLESK